MYSERLNIETSYLVQHCISHRMTAITPKVGVVRSHDPILQYNLQ